MFRLHVDPCILGSPRYLLLVEYMIIKNLVSVDFLKTYMLPSLTVNLCVESEPFAYHRSQCIESSTCYYYQTLDVQDPSLG